MADDDRRQAMIEEMTKIFDAHDRMKALSRALSSEVAEVEKILRQIVGPAEHAADSVRTATRRATEATVGLDGGGGTTTARLEEAVRTIQAALDRVRAEKAALLVIANAQPIDTSGAPKA